MTDELLGQMIGRNPLRSQREACTVSARRSIAAFGAFRSDKEIKSISVGLASGLFGEAYADAPIAEQDRMIAMVEEEYRKCLDRS